MNRKPIAVTLAAIAAATVFATTAQASGLHHSHATRPVKAAVSDGPILVSTKDQNRVCVWQGLELRQLAIDATFRLAASSSISYWLLQDGSQVRVDPYGGSVNLPTCTPITPIAIPAAWAND